MSSRLCKAPSYLHTATLSLRTSTRQPSPTTQVGVSVSAYPCMNSQVSLVKRGCYSFWGCFIPCVSKGNPRMRAFMSPQVTTTKCSSREWSFQTHTTMQRIQHLCSPHFKEQATRRAAVTCPVSLNSVTELSPKHGVADRWPPPL